MDLAFLGDATGNGELETFLIRSRWLESRAGRADAAVTGGELGAYTFAETECWDESLAVTYTVSNYTLTEDGDPSACVFSAPSYSADADIE